MAKREARGWRSYVPTIRGVAKILIVLMVLKVVISYVGPNLPAQIQPYVPTL